MKLVRGSGLVERGNHGSSEVRVLCVSRPGMLEEPVLWYGATYWAVRGKAGNGSHDASVEACAAGYLAVDQAEDVDLARPGFRDPDLAGRGGVTQRFRSWSCGPGRRKDHRKRSREREGQVRSLPSNLDTSKVDRDTEHGNCKQVGLTLDGGVSGAHSQQTTETLIATIRKPIRQTEYLDVRNQKTECTVPVGELCPRLHPAWERTT